MKKILMYNYSLSVYFARGRKELLEKGTWFLFANELFFILISLSMFIVTRLNFKLHDIILGILLLSVWSSSFYGTKSWLIKQLHTERIAEEYNNIQTKTLNMLIGLSLFIGAFVIFIIVGILTFEGYFV